jgi:hypothetical protein
LRDAADTLVAAVEQAINHLDLTEMDAAAAQLARKYAAVIDNCDNQEWAMRWVAPGLLDALESLGATPLARTRIKQKPGGPPSQLEKLRAARRA